MAIREARSLARVPLEQQVVRWQAAQEKKNDDGARHGTSDNRPPGPSRIIAKALSEFHSQPQLLADVLRTHLGPDGVKTLLAVLADQPATV